MYSVCRVPVHDAEVPGPYHTLCQRWAILEGERKVMCTKEKGPGASLK